MARESVTINSAVTLAQTYASHAFATRTNLSSRTWSTFNLEIAVTAGSIPPTTGKNIIVVYGFSDTAIDPDLAATSTLNANGQVVFTCNLAASASANVTSESIKIRGDYLYTWILVPDPLSSAVTLTTSIIEILEPDFTALTDVEVGRYNSANALNSIAIGYYNTADGNSSSAFGYNNSSGSAISSAVGYHNLIDTMSTNGSAFGSGNALNTAASSSVFGFSNTVSAAYSSSFGYGNVISSGTFSTSVGMTTTLSGSYSIAVGPFANVTGDSSLSVGRFCNASANNASVFGYNVNTTVNNTTEIGYWSGPTARLGAVRIHGTGAVSWTVEKTNTAKTDGGATKGSEADGTLMRSGLSFRVTTATPPHLIVAYNDAGTIKSLDLGALT